MINWEEHHKALQTRNEGTTKAEQLAGKDVMFFAGMHELHGQKFKDLAEAVLLDMRYKLKFEYEKEVLVRLGIESLLRAMTACSLEVNKKKEEPKKTKSNLKI